MVRLFSPQKTTTTQSSTRTMTIMTSKCNKFAAVLWKLSKKRSKLRHALRKHHTEETLKRRLLMKSEIQQSLMTSKDHQWWKTQRIMSYHLMVQMWLWHQNGRNHHPSFMSDVLQGAVMDETRAMSIVTMSTSSTVRRPGQHRMESSKAIMKTWMTKLDMNLLNSRYNLHR